MPRSTVLTIGNFDAVHKGHAALIHRARAIAGEGARVVALAFDPHPISQIAPGREPPRLSTFSQRETWLRQAGADEVHRLEPTPDLLSQTPETFIRQMVDRFAPTAIVEGPDFHFGRARSGTIDTLSELGRRHAFEVVIVPPVEVDLTDQSIVTASSSIIRWLLSHARVRDAARVMGRPYEVEGVVVRGDQRGRTIGFPTANLQTPLMPPADGVYAGIAILPDGRSRPAAIHVGPRATFDAPIRTIEPFILDWDGPVSEGAPEYDWPLRLRFIAWLRDQARFDSVDALVEQMHHDVARTRDIIARELAATPEEISA
ncbi:MAG: bifunctional riboflavin kinase/FMN adenylyltransferase [Phycisphaeraceae bacterium]|nr:MAG: bifunctional riboflavin kinase/FMN adenylyltransferase [Phycisphaeraceae bacterium]